MSLWQNPPIMRYAAVGSRETPEDILVLQFHIGRIMCDLGWHGLSGLADGSDEKYYIGAKTSSNFDKIGFTNIIPWDGFTGGSKDSLVKHYQDIDNNIFNFEAMPNSRRAWFLGIGARGGDWGLLKRNWTAPVGKRRFTIGGMALHGRNAMQILSPTLRNPVRLVHCYAKPLGVEAFPVSGGTATAVSLARHFKIPVTNLAVKEGLLKTLDFLKLHNVELDYNHYEAIAAGYRV